MADFLENCKRHESSEGSNIDDEEEFENDFVKGTHISKTALLN